MIEAKRPPTGTEALDDVDGRFDFAQIDRLATIQIEVHLTADRAVASTLKGGLYKLLISMLAVLASGILTGQYVY